MRLGHSVASKLLALLLGLGLLLAPLPAAPPAAASPPPEDEGPSPAVAPFGHALGPGELKRLLASDERVTVIVRLAEEALAAQRRAPSAYPPPQASAGPRPSAEGPRLDLGASAARRYAASLARARVSFRELLVQRIPEAKVVQEYSVTFHGLAVQLPASRIPLLLKLPGVRAATLERRFYPLLDNSVPQIGAPEAWPALGGAANAGAGVKIALLDTGIDQSHPFLKDDTLVPPPGFPKGNLAYTSNKVIVAKNYSDEMVRWPNPADDMGHGTHLSGIIAGRYGYQTPKGVTLSGIAPRAFLMNYKVLYDHGDLGYFGTEAQIIAAIEEAVKDGADILNLSLGGAALTDPSLDPEVIAVNNAAAAGVVVVIAAGNEGPHDATVSSPGTAREAITVGAATTSKMAVYPVSATTPGTPPGEVTDLDGVKFDGTPPITAPIGPARVVRTNLDGTPREGTSLSGAIALIQRGEFFFRDKINNAAAAGAIAAVIWNHNLGQEPFIGSAQDTRIPGVMISYESGQALLRWLDKYGEAARLKIGYPPLPRPDVLVDFSSRGPSADYGLKPDLLAPGVNILSSVIAKEDPSGFTAWSGTSMAVPHVVGAAALLKQRHPGWSPRQIKAALLATAKPVYNLGHKAAQGIMNAGAGRVDIAAAANLGLLVDPPAHSFGRYTIASDTKLSAAQTFTVEDISGQGGTYQLAVAPRRTTAGLTLEVSPSSLTLAPNGTSKFTLSAKGPVSLTPGDYEGFVELAGPSRARIPYWIRVQAGVPIAKGSVLMVDELGTYSKVPYKNPYFRAIGDAGYTYSYWDVTANGYPTAAAMAKAAAVVWVQAQGRGSYMGTHFFLSALEQSWEAVQRELMAYLDGGGRLFLTSQETAWWSSIVAGTDDPFMRKYLHARYLADDPGGRVMVGDAQDPIGSLFADGIDAEQDWPDELGLWAADSLATPVLFFRGTPQRPNRPTDPLPGDVRIGNLAAVRVGAEPSLEAPGLASYPTLPYRLYYQSVTPEGISDEATRTALMKRVLDWLTGNITVQMGGPYLAAQDMPVTLSATASSNIPDATIARYKWDFGDGSPLVITSTPAVIHRYAQVGTFYPRVEVTDSLGHRALSPPGLVAVGMPTIYLPVVGGR